ncbi:dolichyl-phosphate-mannose--protein mannosyltransferase [Thermococcus profundus]|uniref:Dolichyl-phosphate-mannose--protein mannosyltransferase n=1 Tax=Thermococcus profundus TaxID=49899 RepID=A0A2Z2M9J0_THEPR|nr:dolichyl-phosphate-mannose--protein mannosyltransferase [Thermococcus profundus]ASJ03210.1 dolichyl-phosphate-mannose--protein mannosyltransferase [Thermococcus profundus]
MVTMRQVKFVLFILVAIGIMGASLWYAFDTASKASLKDYVGDEVWYVPAARNTLHRLGLQAHYVHNGYEGVNVIFASDKDKLKYRHFVDEALVIYKGNMSATISYKEFPGMYVEIPREKMDKFLKHLEDNIPPEAYYVVTGYQYPDKDNIQNYLNTEHPFLGKDFIMLSMLLFGDYPYDWRVPGLVLYGLLQLLVLLTAYRITKSYLASLIALFFAAVDPTLQATAVTAMLDIYVAAFVMIFVFLLTYGWRNLSGLGIGLGAATKLSGAFGYPVLFLRLLADLKGETDWKKGVRIVVVLALLGGAIVAYAEHRAGFWDAKYFYILTLLTLLALAEFSYSSRDAVKELVYVLNAGLILPLVGFIIPELPIIKAYGFDPWLRDFLGSFKWHLSYKGENPWTAPFWEWFYNGNSFHFHFNPDVVASTNPTLLLFMIVAIFAIPYVWKRRGEGALVPFGVFWSTVLLFALQYAMGGKTQFSFYATALVPEAAVVMGVVVYDIVNWEAFTDSLLDYLYWLGRICRIGRFVDYVENKRAEKEEKAEETTAPTILPSIPLPPTVYVQYHGLPKKRAVEREAKRREPKPGGLPRKGGKSESEKASEEDEENL